jgi:16S rRNA processing protein RimM
VNQRVDRVAVGRVTRAHGVHGEVSILPLTEVPERFEPGSRLLLDAAAAGERSLTVATSRIHRGRPLIRFDGIADRDAAELLAGAYLFVPADASPTLPEGTYWPHELVGCQVRTVGGRTLGTLTEIVRTPANDVWIADGDAGQILIPALRDVVLDVDRNARLVTVAEIEGLTT